MNRVNVVHLFLVWVASARKCESASSSLGRYELLYVIHHHPYLASKMYRVRLLPVVCEEINV